MTLKRLAGCAILSSLGLGLLFGIPLACGATLLEALIGGTLIAAASALLAGLLWFGVVLIMDNEDRNDF